MRFIHPATWAGIFFNCFLIYVLFSAFNNLDISTIPPSERALIEMVQSARPILFLMLVAQVVAIALIASRFAAGLVLAGISAFFMMPASILYLMGCLLSHFNWKYDAFAAAPKGYAGAIRQFRAVAARNMWYATAASMGLCFVTFAGGMIDLAAIFLSTGIASIYMAMRSGEAHALSLHETYIIIVPALLAKRILVPYDTVNKAALLADETIIFEVRTGTGTYPLTWSLRSVEPASRREALEELGAALTAHNVPLL